jgi:hypothetical protein
MKQQFEPERADEKVHHPIVLNENVSVEEVKSTQKQQDVSGILAQAKQKMRLKRKRFWSMFLLTVVGPVAGIVYLLFFALELALAKGLHPALLMLLTGMLACSLFIKAHLSGLDFDALELAHQCGIRAIPSLMEALNEASGPKQFQQLYDALADLLRQLKPGDAPLLTRPHRKQLNWILEHAIETSYTQHLPETVVLAVLKAWEQVGDVEALPYVEKLAHWKPRNEREKHFQQAAQACLPYLQASANLITEQQTLLRPSHAQNLLTDTLLRPAHFTDEAPHEELLRPSQLETDSGQNTKNKE